MTSETVRKAPLGRAAIYLSWSLIVLLIFLWQAATYSGLIGLSAEWQFAHFGAYRPALTFLVFTALLIFIPLLIDQRRGEANHHALATAGASSTRFFRWLLGSAMVCFAISLFCLVQIWVLPEGSGPIRSLNASDPHQQPFEGATAIRGRVLYKRSAVLKEDFWFVKRELRVAPLVASGAEGAPVRFWIELPREANVNPDLAASVPTGILRKGALPGELIHLYRSAGFTVAADHYVLFHSTATMNWPYRRDGLFWCLMGLLILLGAGGQRWYQRRVMKRLFRETATAA